MSEGGVVTGRTPEKFVREFSHSIVPGHRVVQTNEVARIGGPQAHAHASTQSTVELVRDGDVVQAIDVTCSCGEKTRIWCSYAAK
jgi:hypothetical protein